MSSCPLSFFSPNFPILPLEKQVRKKWRCYKSQIIKGKKGSEEGRNKEGHKRIVENIYLGSLFILK